MSALQLNELEDLYDELAQALDVCQESQESVFMAKLVLRLANELGDAQRVSRLIAECRQVHASPTVRPARIL